MIEMLVTITVIGIIAVTASTILLPMFNAQQGIERRAALVEAAESAVRRMARDIRIAIPNSVRTTNVLAVGTGFAIELIPSADGGRYCTSGTADCSSLALAESLTIGTPESAFDILGCFHNATFAPLVLPANSTLYRLVVGNTDSGIYTATGASAVITPAGNTLQISLFPNTGTLNCGAVSGTLNSSNRHRVTLVTAAHTFPTASPRQRVFVVEDSLAPVTYLCDSAAGTLTRYAGYKNGAAYSSSPLQPTAPAVLTGFGATGRLVTDSVTACSVTSTEANVQTSGVVTLSLTLSNSGETVQLTSQVQLDNSQ